MCFYNIYIKKRNKNIYLQIIIYILLCVQQLENFLYILSEGKTKINKKKTKRDLLEVIVIVFVKRKTLVMHFKFLHLDAKLYKQYKQITNSSKTTRKNSINNKYD